MTLGNYSAFKTLFIHSTVLLLFFKLSEV